MQSLFVSEILFKCHFECGFGEEVRLSGNIVDLGLNSEHSAIPLVTSSDEFPVWRSQTVLVLRGDPDQLEFRFCLFSGGRFKRWETVEKRLLRNCIACVKGIVVADSTFDQPQKDAEKSKTADPLTTHFKEQMMEDIQSVDKEIDSTDIVVSVSYYLPVVLSKSDPGEWKVKCNHNHVLAFKLPKATTVYVGSVQFDRAAVSKEDRKAVIALLRQHNCFPVFVEDNMHRIFYEEYCGQNVRPQLRHKLNAFQDLAQLVSEERRPEQWLVYNEVLDQFRRTVIEAYQPGNLIWIHGYELMLLPSKMRRKLRDAKIGYYFHMPLSSTDVWGRLDQKHLLMRGMLGANAIGFHAHDYAQNFVSSCCRMLGYHYYCNKQGSLCLNVDGNEVVITSVHKGINYDSAVAVCDKPGFWTKVDEWSTRFAGKRVFAGYVWLAERLKLTSMRFMEISRFLEHNPQWHNKVVFTILGKTPSLKTEIYHRNVQELNAWAKLLNDRYGGEHVVIEERSRDELGLADRLAYFAAADYMLLNVVPHGTLEYPMEFTVACSKRRERCHARGLPVPNNGVVILSSSHPTSKNFAGAILVNTRQEGEVEQAIMVALRSDQSDSTERLYPNLSYCVLHTASTWAVSALNDLKSTTQVEGAPNLKNATSLGSLSFYRDLIGKFTPLDTEELYEAYRKTFHRLILLNAESLHVASPEHRSAIEALCVDKKNLVFMISGKSQHHIEENYGNFKYLGLAAEHGFYFRWPIHKLSSDKLDVVAQSQPIADWQSPLQRLDTQWQEPTKRVMELFTIRTVRSFVEVFEHSIYWQYGEADPEFGPKQSRELEEFLNRLLANHEVDIIRGCHKERKYIHVRSKKISKAHFLENVLLTLRSIGVKTDFVLAVGDDESDESLFNAANELQMPAVAPFGQKACFTTVIGKRRTAAKMLVETESELMNIVKRLSRNAVRETKFYSTSDLYSLATSKKAIHKDATDGPGFASRTPRETRFTRYNVQHLSERRAAKDALVSCGGGGGGGSDATVQPIKVSHSAPLLTEIVSQEKLPVPVTSISPRGPAPPASPLWVRSPQDDMRSTSMKAFLGQMSDEEEEPPTF